MRADEAHEQTMAALLAERRAAEIADEQALPAALPRPSQPATRPIPARTPEALPADLIQEN